MNEEGSEPVSDFNEFRESLKLKGIWIKACQANIVNREEFLEEARDYKFWFDTGKYRCESGTFCSLESATAKRAEVSYFSGIRIFEGSEEMDESEQVDQLVIAVTVSLVYETQTKLTKKKFETYKNWVRGDANAYADGWLHDQAMKMGIAPELLKFY